MKRATLEDLKGLKKKLKKEEKKPTFKQAVAKPNPYQAVALALQQRVINLKNAVLTGNEEAIKTERQKIVEFINTYIPEKERARAIERVDYTISQIRL